LEADEAEAPEAPPEEEKFEDEEEIYEGGDDPSINRARPSVTLDEITFEFVEPVEIDGDEAERIPDGYIIMS
jgi:hypothetical protein